MRTPANKEKSLTELLLERCRKWATTIGVALGAAAGVAVVATLSIPASPLVVIAAATVGGALGGYGGSIISNSLRQPEAALQSPELAPELDIERATPSNATSSDFSNRRPVTLSLSWAGSSLDLNAVTSSTATDANLGTETNTETETSLKFFGFNRDQLYRNTKLGRCLSLYRKGWINAEKLEQEVSKHISTLLKNRRL